MKSYLFYKCKRIFCFTWYLKYPSASLCLFTLISPNNTDIAGLRARDHTVYSLGEKC